MIKRIIIGLLVFVVFLVGSAYYAGDDSAVGGVGPDSILYYLDIAVEWVDLNLLTWNEQKKMELRIELMHERLNEIKTLADIEKINQKARQKAENSFNDLKENVTNYILQKTEEKIDEQTNKLKKQMEDVLEKQKQEFIQTIDNVF
jgi:ElaB/YqjD/DUF883 family membrane-anchored ribosome-binding protein